MEVCYLFNPHHRTGCIEELHQLFCLLCRPESVYTKFIRSTNWGVIAMATVTLFFTRFKSTVSVTFH